MSKQVNVYLGEDPYLTSVVVKTVTKCGKFLNTSGAQELICGGHVTVDGTVHKMLHTILSPGPHVLTVRDDSYNIVIHHPLLE